MDGRFTLREILRLTALRYRCARTPADQDIAIDRRRLEFAHWLDSDGILDLHQHSRANEDLTRFGLVTQPRGDVGHRADGRIVKSGP